MAMKLLEAMFTIGLVGFVVTHPTQFSSLVKTAGTQYSALVKGLEATS